jgi:hypothetical protein
MEWPFLVMKLWNKREGIANQGIQQLGRKPALSPSHIPQNLDYLSFL